MRHRMNGVRPQPICCCLRYVTYIHQSVWRNKVMPDPCKFLHIFSDLKIGGHATRWGAYRFCKSSQELTGAMQGQRGTFEFTSKASQVWRLILHRFICLARIGIFGTLARQSSQIHQVNSCEDLQNPQTFGATEL